MLDQLPHPTLLPRRESTFNRDNLRILPPLPVASPPSVKHRRSNSGVDSTSLWPSSRTSSPTRSSAFLPPFLRSARGRSLSPERVSPAEAAQFGTISVDAQLEHAVNLGKLGSLASWFGGTSEPVNITLIPSPSKEKHDPFFEAAEMDWGSARSSMSRDNDTLTKRPSAQACKSYSSQAAPRNDSPGSRFAFWRSKTSSSPEREKGAEDKLSALDIPNALFPSGKSDYTSSEDFNRLQTHAENALQTFKTVYQKNLRSLHDVTSEKAALTDELGAAQARSENSKSQLANMAEKLGKQEAEIQTMRQELATIRQQQAEFRHRSLRIVTPESLDRGAGMTEDSSNTPDFYIQGHEPTDLSSALENHSPTSSSASDSSVFSQPQPELRTTSTPTSIPEDNPATPSHIFHQRKSNAAKPGYQNYGGGGGGRPSEAWDVVYVLTEENRSLKARLAECENASEDALRLLTLVGSA